MGNWYEYDFVGKKALLVEDHPINAWLEQKMLEKVGFEVIIASDGSEGVETYRKSEGHFDVILMDINMPVMNGLLAARMIRTLDIERAGDIPIIAMTTNCFPEDIRESKRAGMNEHLIKPIDPDVLFACLSRYLLAQES